VVRRAALAAVRGRKDPGLAAHVAKLAHDPEKSVRVALAELLEEDLLPGMDATVVALLEDGDENVRVAATKSSRKRAACEAALLALLEEAGEPSWRVRQNAAQALAWQKARGVILPLLHSIGSDSARPVQTASAVTLDAHLKAIGGWPADLGLPDQPLLEAINARLGQIGAAKFPVLAPFIAHKASTEVDLKKLRDFGTDLLAEMDAGRIARAYGVDSVVSTLRDLLVQGKTRAAVLLGEPGSGKTAIVHELAHRLAAEKDGPWRIVRTSPVEILAGTRYLGEWQTKLNDLVNLAKSPKRVILYIPNLQELSDAGRTVQSDVNMATALAPHIESGKIAILGESTPEAFRGGLGAIGSLRRLFHAVDVPEATPEATRTVLERIRRDAGVEMSAPVMDRMIELADYYLSGVAQPGRAAGLLRRVIELNAGTKKSLLLRDVLETLSSSTGVPMDLLDDAVALDLAKVRAFFDARVMGQTEAVDAVLDVVSLVKAGLTDPGKPFSVLFFVGPTGVGKTELARALAEYLFGDAKRMVRFDMSEFATYDAFERLIGRGHTTTGLLTSAVRERPFSVLLLDEIEKAHTNVFDLCLQLFDAGRLTDAAGRTADFRRTIIILTSNVGSRISRDAGLGFGSESKSVPPREHVMRELERVFRPEFLNRLDRIITFAPLAEETAEKIARREVAAVLERSGITRRGL
ncbi:MAG TPA: AAA family ATPase, partial [bacterium]|nr:AAA family ATPase [bacterium]